MTDNLISSVTAVATALLGVAIIAVLVGSQSKTADVISSAGSAFAKDIQAAVAPVTGGAGGFGGFSLSGNPIGSVNY